MKKVKMLVGTTIAGRSVVKDEVAELDDQLADGFVNSKLAELAVDEPTELLDGVEEHASEPMEESEGHHKRKKK
jgi:hypothetical protein